MESRESVATPNSAPSEPIGSNSEPAFFNAADVDQEIYRTFCIDRLSQLASLRAQIGAEQGAEADLHCRLLDRALYTVYHDCVGAHVGAEARRVLEQVVHSGGGQGDN